MPTLLDLTWKPTAASPTLPTDVFPYIAPAIYRHSPYSITFTLLDGEDPYTPTGELVAQIRPARLAAGVTAGEPLAEFEVTIDANEVTIALTPTQTAALPDAAYWDIQEYDGDDPLGTWFTGKVKAWGDITRDAA